MLVLFSLLTIPVSAQNGQKTVFGYSGEGRELVAYRYGNGEHVLVMCFALHGYEDNWDQDGRALVYSAGKLQEYLQTSELPDLHNWTVYVLPCLNPDGLYSGWTNNGPGRCTTTYFDKSGKLVSGKGIDMNRCFPTWYRPMSNSRNFNADTPMACREAQAIAQFIQQVRSSKTNVLIDVHGWLEQTITTSTRIRSAVQSNFPTNRITDNNGGTGYLMTYAHTLGYESCLLELPAHFTNLNQYMSSDCTQRIIQTVQAVLKSEQTACSLMGHQYQMLEQSATCTREGYVRKVCKSCQKEEKTVYPALGHTPAADSIVIVQEPTASRAGLRSYTCIRCGTAGLTQKLEPVFRDVQAEGYYADALDRCYDLGYIKGVSKDTFGPDTWLSRAMLVTVLHRFAGAPEGGQTVPFTDVQADGYYIQALNWAWENGIIQGVSDTEFSPHTNVTREQAITIFHRYVQLCSADNGLRAHDPFPDEDKISAYALEAAHWSAANGIIVGDEKARLNPGAFATRAQSVTILMRLENYLNQVSWEETTA